MVKILGAQRDFSYGEVDPDFKRADEHPARKAGLRQCANARIRNSGILQNRAGRRALYQNSTGCTRIEEFTISTGNTFKIAFGPARIEVRDAAGALAFSSPQQGNGAALPWNAGNLDQVVYAVSPSTLTVYVTFPGMVPQVLNWNGVATWTITDYAELVFSGQKRTLFYRISPQGITLLPGARTGAGVSLHASAAVFKAGHVGTRMRFVGRQMLITAVGGTQDATVTIMEALPGHQNLATATDPTTKFSIGDEVIGQSSGSKGLITAISAGGIDVQLLSNNSTVVNSLSFVPELGVVTNAQTFSFVTNETIVGPGGSIVIGTASAIDNPTIGVPVWDEEVMNSLQGWPASCFVDQYRLGFCNFPTLPSAIAWSAVNAPTDLYIGPNPSDAIFETVPGKVQVYYVIPGPESSEFIFCDHGIFYVKIDAANPLKPGGIGFQKLSSDGAAQVQPRISQELILYANAGGSSMMAVVATGAYYRPFNTKNLSDFHAHLFNNIRAIAVPTADGQFNERYAYVLNGDFSLTVGKYNLNDVASSNDYPKVGWVPWSGAGAIQWIAAWNADVIFTTSQFGVGVCEILDDTVYLDCMLPVNALPAAFTPSPGQGPLGLFAGHTVTLMDQGTRVLGNYQIDVDGKIVPQNTGGENLLAPTLAAGLAWTMTVEPFPPSVAPGNDVEQRWKERQISIFAAWVRHSTGFIMAGLFSGRRSRTSPAFGDVVNQYRVAAYNADDDATLPPPDRETVECHKPPGTTYDPRVAIIKETPGPLQILELVIECTG